MPKPARHLWEKVLEWDNLVLAAREASRHKRCYDAVLRFNARLEDNLIFLREQLRSGQWRPGPFRPLRSLNPSGA